jgi:hypothetical protein
MELQQRMNISGTGTMTKRHAPARPMTAQGYEDEALYYPLDAPGHESP